VPIRRYTVQSSSLDFASSHKEGSAFLVISSNLRYSLIAGCNGYPSSIHLFHTYLPDSERQTVHPGLQWAGHRPSEEQLYQGINHNPSVWELDCINLGTSYTSADIIRNS